MKELRISGKTIVQTIACADSFIPAIIGRYYRVIVPFKTRAGETYKKGDQLLVVGRTNFAPYDELCSLGNLYIRGKNNKITVWSTFDKMIELQQVEIQHV